ncbi:MAG: TPM domain-containing protein [Opitutaceae bacterium]|nr:TPM domain-containing protein [Opitutaceae bacterium]
MLPPSWPAPVFWTRLSGVAGHAASMITAWREVQFVRVIGALVLCVMLAESALADMPAQPASREFLHDYAQVIPADLQRVIRERQAAAFQGTQVPIVIVTLPNLWRHDLGTREIEIYAQRWFDGWGIGSATKNDGILILLVVEERAARIELGKAWAHRWDGYAKGVMNGRMVPRFKQGEYGAGLLAGLEALERMADRGAGSNPPAFSAWEKFAGSPLGYYALYDNPLKRSVGIPISYALLALGGLIALAGCFVGEHRVLLWKIGGGLIGLVLLFWIVAAAILLMSGLLQYLRNAGSDKSGTDSGYGGGSSGGGGATGRW